MDFDSLLPLCRFFFDFFFWNFDFLFALILMASIFLQTEARAVCLAFDYKAQKTVAIPKKVNEKFFVWMCTFDICSTGRGLFQPYRRLSRPCNQKETR